MPGTYAEAYEHNNLDLPSKPYQTEKIIIMDMRETLLEVQVYIRLLSDMRHISEGRYSMLAEQTVSMAKQLAAWEKSEREKNSDG